MRRNFADILLFDNIRIVIEKIKVHSNAFKD
jgi:hypothetical protein